jgi:hypothetical protein
MSATGGGRRCADRGAQVTGTPEEMLLRAFGADRPDARLTRLITLTRARTALARLDPGSTL